MSAQHSTKELRSDAGDTKERGLMAEELEPSDAEIVALVRTYAQARRRLDEASMARNAAMEAESEAQRLCGLASSALHAAIGRVN